MTCRRRRVRLQKSSTAGQGPETSPEPGPGPAEATRPADSRFFLLFDSSLSVFGMFQVWYTSSSSDILAGMQCARCPTILVLVALVLCGPGVSSQPDRDQDQYQNQDLDLELRHHRLLQRARSAGLLSQVRDSKTNQNAKISALISHHKHLSRLNQ